MPNPRPTALRTCARRAALAAVAVTAGSTTFTAAPAQAGANEPRLDTRERQVLHRVNAVRADHGLARLAFGRKLSRAADHHSRRSQQRRTVAHTLPGEQPLEGRLAHAARVKPIGEVIYWTRRGASSAEIVRAWMRSPGHRALLLSPDFGRAGIGIRTGRTGLYATVDLAAS
ncbi:MAG: CAP domain-containing protein [Solirubrobacteraceae bacterium]|nr:CAP domain-containing protein [Solirubrobacteraceae bacterium]